MTPLGMRPIYRLKTFLDKAFSDTVIFRTKEGGGLHQASSSSEAIAAVATCEL